MELVMPVVFLPLARHSVYVEDPVLPLETKRVELTATESGQNRDRFVDFMDHSV
jgi:hypothetical protein